MDMVRAGPLSLTVLGVALAGLACLSGCALLGLRGRRVSAPLWVVPASAVTTVGLLAALFGLGVALEAASHMRSSLVMSMVAAGAALALEPAVLGCAAGGVLALLAAWVLALAPLLLRAPEGRWSLGHGLVPALLSVVGTPLLAWLAGPVAAVVALLGTFPCVLVALRRSPPVGGEPSGARRLVVAALAPLGALVIAQALRIHDARRLFEAVAFASAHTGTELLAAVAHHANAPATVLAALLVLVAGAAAVAPVARGRWDRSAWIGLATFALLLVPPLAARGLLVERLQHARDAARPWYDDRVQALATEGLELPRGTAGRIPEDMLTLSLAPGELAVGGLPLSWEAEWQDGLHWPLFRALDSQAVGQAELGYGAVPFRGMLLLQVDRSLPWSQVEPILRTAVGARFGTAHVAVADDQRRLRVFTLTLVGETHAEAGSTPPPAPGDEAGEPTVGRFVSLTLGKPEAAQPRIVLEALEGVWRIGAPGMEPGLARDTAQLTEAALRIKGEYPEDEDLRVVPFGSTTWGELVAALDAVRLDPVTATDLFPYPQVVLTPAVAASELNPRP